MRTDAMTQSGPVEAKIASLVLPSPRISGGVKEAISMLGFVARVGGADGETLLMWRSADESVPLSGGVIALSEWPARWTRAWWQWPVIAWRFRCLLRSREGKIKRVWLFTHYVTVPLAFLVPRPERCFFVQDLEWRFAGKGWLSLALRNLLKMAYSRGQVVVANAYLKEALESEGIKVSGMYPIWASDRFAQPEQPGQYRDVDLLCVIRKGVAKRSDLYFDLIKRIRLWKENVSIHVILTDADFLAQARDLGVNVSMNLGSDQMAALYKRAKVFVLLSDHEGFGLPPLEAMGAGCVPVCRQAGGTSAYMVDALERLHVPPEASIGEVAELLRSILVSEVEWQGLSDASRRIFEKGRHQSMASRVAAARTIWGRP